MKRIVGLLAVLTVAALGCSVGSAWGDPFAGPPICPSAGTPIAGAHNNVTITGNAYVPELTTLTVSGNLTLAPGSCLDAFTLALVTVHGNVTVGNGAILALGCSPGAIGPEPPCEEETTEDYVGGNIFANSPWTLYLTAVDVEGNVVSRGGGPGPTFKPYVNFAIKENEIDGNLVLERWKGAWFGALRNFVGGNTIINGNIGANEDSTEIGTNLIFGNLACESNSPAAQFGDSGAEPNLVQGRTTGQCLEVVGVHPSPKP